MDAATSRVFAAAGAKVVIADRLDVQGHSLAKELGATAAYQHHDVSDEGNWKSRVAERLAVCGDGQSRVVLSGASSHRTMAPSRPRPTLAVTMNRMAAGPGDAV